MCVCVYAVQTDGSGRGRALSWREEKEGIVATYEGSKLKRDFQFSCFYFRPQPSNIFSCCTTPSKTIWQKIARKATGGTGTLSQKPSDGTPRKLSMQEQAVIRRKQSDFANKFSVQGTKSRAWGLGRDRGVSKAKKGPIIEQTKEGYFDL